MGDCGGETPLELFLDLIGSGGSPDRPRAIEVNRPYPSWIVAHSMNYGKRFRVAGKIGVKISHRALSEKPQLFWSWPALGSIDCARSCLTFASVHRVAR